MTSRSRSSRVTLPEFIYGTAWKKDQTKRLVKEALAAGFRKVDTAAQPKHYQEDLVGEGLREAYAEGIVRREDLIVRAKYAITIFGTYKSRCKPNSLNLADKI
jgi:diketogulonate reductase-like aldo/keto reductase